MRYTGAMHNRSGNSSARVSVGGAHIDITVAAKGNTPTSPILDGDVRMSRNHFAHAKTGTEVQMHEAIASEGTFVKPARVIHAFGIREGMAVADFGAGSGGYATPFAKLVGPTGHVFMVEVQRDVLTRIQNEVSAQGFENVDVVWGDIEKHEGTRIASGTLDVVLVSNTLFQVDDRHAVIHEAYRTLKKDGTLVIIDWSESFAGLGPPENMLMRRPEAMILCTDNGFTFIRDFPTGEYHYGLLFKKAPQGNSSEEDTSAQKGDDDFITRTIAQELL